MTLDHTPFYGEMGGQVGDTGVLVSEEETIEVIDTKRENEQSVHIVKQLPKNLEADFMACVDIDRREGSAANHTATHLLDYAEASRAYRQRHDTPRPPLGRAP